MFREGDINGTTCCHPLSVVDDTDFEETIEDFIVFISPTLISSEYTLLGEPSNTTVHINDTEGTDYIWTGRWVGLLTPCTHPSTRRRVPPRCITWVPASYTLTLGGYRLATPYTLTHSVLILSAHMQKNNV